jgi:hypothetical protein
MGRKVTNTSPEAAAQRKRSKKSYYNKKLAKEKLQTVSPSSAPANSDAPSTQKNTAAKTSVRNDSHASESNSHDSDKEIRTKIPTLYLPAGFGKLLPNQWFWEVLELRQASDVDFARLNSERTYDDAFLIGEAGVRSYPAVQMLIDRYPELIRLKREDVQPWLENLSEFSRKFEQEPQRGGSPPLKGGTPPPPLGIRGAEKTSDQPHLRLVALENGSGAKPTNGFHKENTPTGHVDERTAALLETLTGYPWDPDRQGPPLQPVRHTFDVLSSLNATARDVKEELLWCREVMRRNAPRAVFTEMCCVQLLRGIETGPEQIEQWQQEYVRLFPETEHFRPEPPTGSEPVPAEPVRSAWVAPVEEENVPAGFDADDPSTHPKEWGPLGWRGGVWRGGKRIEPAALPPIPNERLCAFVVKMFGATQNAAYLEREWTAEEEELIEEVYSQAVALVTDQGHAYALLLAWISNYAAEPRREHQDGVQIGHTPVELLRDLVKYAKPAALDYPKEQWAIAGSILERLEKFRARYIWGFEHGR